MARTLLDGLNDDSYDILGDLKN